LIKLFDLPDHFQIIDRQSTIVVGAPHHGTRPNVDADVGTGPIALALAEKLNARAVIVSDLRRKVDVNKDAKNLHAGVRHYAVRYQNEMFKGLPRLVIEVHGHTSGQYPIEITTGFDLSPSIEGDASFLERLQKLKQTLPALLASKLGQKVPLGIYPLDRDVKKTATNTFTFQKIRRARKLIGCECYGLHIELAAEFRASPRAKTPEYVNAVAEALAAAISGTFDPLPDRGAVLSVGSQPDVDQLNRAGVSFRVARSSHHAIAENAVMLHPEDISTLGSLAGDPIYLYNDGEEFRGVLAPSRTIRRGDVAIPARIRRQLNVDVQDRILLGRTTFHHPGSASQHKKFLLSAIHPAKDARIWLTPQSIEQHGFVVGKKVRVKNRSAYHLAIVDADQSIPDKTVMLSSSIADKFPLTIGEVLTIEV
jgi:anaerobic selenocysteine-containing dehydrogenase